MLTTDKFISSVVIKARKLTLQRRIRTLSRYHNDQVLPALTSASRRPSDIFSIWLLELIGYIYFRINRLYGFWNLLQNDKKIILSLITFKVENESTA